MFRRGMSTRPHGMHGEPPHCGAEFQHADIRTTGNSVSPLLPFHGLRVVREHRAVIAACSTNGNARPVVAEILVLTLIDALQSIHFAPTHLPRSPVASKPRNGRVHGSLSRNPHSFRILRPGCLVPHFEERLLPTVKECH